MADRSFACQFSCTNPCNATHQAFTNPAPPSEWRCQEPASRGPPGSPRPEGRAARWLQMADRLICSPIFLLRSMQRHASAFTNPAPPSERRCQEPASRGPPGSQGQEGRAARWLQMADRSFACQFSCSNPCNATHQPSRIPRPQASGAARSPPAGARRAAQGRRGERRAGSGCSFILSCSKSVRAMPLQPVKAYS